MDETVGISDCASPAERSPDIEDLQLTRQKESGSDDDSINAGSDVIPQPDEVSEEPQINGKNEGSGEKRKRKRVQRLSETWNRVHEAKEEERVKAFKVVSASLESGAGTALGEIPLIESTLRKVKPVDLKVLHLIIYSRPGNLTEIRSNLRKFKGFGFESSSDQYEKKLNLLKNRSLNDLRGSLRILNLEVSGTRDQLAVRLMNFLHKPSPSSVKYKGKVVKKSSGRRKSKSDNSSRKPKSKSKRKAVSSDQSVEGTNDDGSDQEVLSESDVNDSNDSNVSSDAESNKKKVSRKRPKPEVSKSTEKPAAKKRAVNHTPKNGTGPKKNELSTDSEEDLPLSSLGKSQTVPTNSQLKKNITEILKTVNLEVTSLKVVREKVFACYPNVDLTDRKEFINDTVKKLLSFS